MRFGLTEMIADEIFQEVCLTLLNKLDSLHTVSRLSAWITTVTKRVSIDHMRRQRPEMDVDDMELASDEARLESELVSMEQATALHVALEQLDVRCQTLLHALFLAQEKPSYDELAGELAIPKGSIGPTRNRCLNKLLSLIHI